MDQTTREALGRHGFEKYNENRGGLTHDGKPIPGWEEIREEIREAWRVQAEAIMVQSVPIIVREVLGVGSFGVALSILGTGKRAARRTWADAGMWLAIISPGNAMFSSPVERLPMQPCIGLRTATGEMQPGWAPSQADMLATDWIALD